MEELLYDSNDMVRAVCNDCKGCFDCCMGMGESIVLDPYDIYLLTTNLNCSFEALLQQHVELKVFSGLILPYIKMLEADDKCGFLNEEGRCAIHAFRPGLCRLFPLGRNYTEDKLQYFLLQDACIGVNRTKVKVKKWLAVEDYKRYESFLIAWHKLRKKLQEEVAVDESEEAEADQRRKQINMDILKLFYQMPYEKDDFYEQFRMRTDEFKNKIAHVI